MIRFYVIRHGETEPNTRFACVGRRDVPLNENGEIQALKLCEKLNEKANADIVYISPLKRAKETIDPYLNANPHIPYEITDDLIERDFGLWEDMNFKQIEEKEPDEFKVWMDNYINYVLPEGESLQTVQERVETFLKRIIPLHDNQTVFITTHLCVSRHLISTLLGLDVEKSRCFTMKNASYAIIDYDIDAGHGVLKYLNI